jgi:2-polyprenyl-6-methoxyphenol hydroxylase-like FAD-dependent oxidoreductase
MKIMIAGGGIGGLATALCLHRAGIRAGVFESVSDIKPLGVGINLLPHCVRVLTSLGLQDLLASCAIETSDLSYYNRLGQLFWTEARGRGAGYNWPQFSIHRGKLQLLLLKVVKERLGEDAVKQSHHLARFEQNEEGVTAFFSRRQGGPVEKQAKGSILIGADGINSAVRGQLYPEEGPPVFSQNVLYRGTSVMPPFLNGSTMVMIGSMKQKMVVYPINKEIDAQGQYLINWVANLKEGSSALTERDWNREADKARLAEQYRGWDFDWLNVPAMIGAAETVYEFPMSDRDPLAQWSFNRVTLLGDAAHPMYPIGSNGASQAILDAEFLTKSLLRHKAPEAALQAYEKERLPATAKVVLQNRAKGPDEIMDLMEERFPAGFTEDEIPQEELETIMSHYKKVAGFDIETLNARGS